jgi:hypothetical protein
MTKRIGDITVAEIRRTCEVYLCHECPLFKNDKELQEFRGCLLYIPDSIPYFKLDEEVEIPEEAE